MTSKPIDFACCILVFMSKVSSIRHPAPWTCTNLLTLLFNHFGVYLDHELKETKPLPIITHVSLKHIQFFKIASGTLKLVEDMTPEELAWVSKKYSQHVKH